MLGFLVRTALADLPTDCTLSNLKGSHWKVSVLLSSKAGAQNCGYPSPNQIAFDLKEHKTLLQKHEETLRGLPGAQEDDTLITEMIELTDDYEDNLGFQIMQGGISVGHWTDIYNQGIMLKPNTQLWGGKNLNRLVAFSAFECGPGKTCSLYGSDSVDRDRKGPSGFKSDCNRTLIGWVIASEGDERYCFYAEKQAATVNLRTISTHQTSKAAITPKSTAEEPVVDYETIDPVTATLHESEPAAAQKDCGSCFVYATLFALKASYVRQRLAMLENNQIAQTSVAMSAILKDLSPFNFKTALNAFTGESCNGGHPIFLATALNFISSTNIKVDFDFIGGAYLKGTEKAIIEHLNLYGPVVVGVDFPSDIGYKPDHSEFSKLPNGKEVLTSSSYSTKFHKSPKITDDWEFANHAMVIIGYGKSGGIKYWVVRNSWGDKWLDHGVIRIERGINFLGIEKHAISIIGKNKI
jgi:Papain family cysteine protease